jgi:hypothetical protein
MLRHVVPVLGALTLYVAAPAQEIAKGLYLDGWVDTIFTVVDTPNALPDTTTQAYPYNTESISTDFSASASLKVGYTVAERVKAKMNLWFRNDGSKLDMREAFIAVDLGNNMSWTIGKFINHLGWISAEPTGLFRVNGSTIGYGAFYGANDPLGTGLGWSDSEGNFGVTGYVTNGYYNAKDGDNVTSVDNGLIKPKNDLGLGLDVTAYFGADKASNVNLEFAYDDNGSTATRTYGRYGYKYQVGLNTTVKPGGKTGALTLGAELLYVTSQYADTNPITAKQENGNQGGALAMANYVLPNMDKWPMSVTGMYQRIEPALSSDSGSTWNTFGIDAKDGKPYYSNTKSASNELSLALLTNPLGDTDFGLNFEIAHAFKDGGANDPAVYPVGVDDPANGVTTVAIEAIAVIP